VPGPVIRAARKYLLKLETEGSTATPQLDLFRGSAPETEPAPAAAHPALDALRDTNPDQLTPREALDLLYRLRKLAE